jgi:hypothetical protein
MQRDAQDRLDQSQDGEPFSAEQVDGFLAPSESDDKSVRGNPEVSRGELEQGLDRLSQVIG